MKKVLFLILLLPFLSGCYARNGGIPWFNRAGADELEVQKGDTLYGISRKYDVSINDLIEKNNLSEPYNIHVGQVLKLPKKGNYTVARGDTLYSIARNNNVNVTTLGKLNGLDEPYTLIVGQKLIIPGSSSSSSRPAPKTTQYAASVPTIASDNKNINKTTNKQIAKATPQKNISTYRKNKFIWPVNGSVVSSFGWVGKGRRNDGINIKAALGTNVKAADKGVVAYAGNELKGFGNLVLIKHSDGYITAYAHNAKLYVKKGQTVLRGEKIATVGNTGSVNTPQLHFEVRAGKKAVNPRSYLP